MPLEQLRSASRRTVGTKQTLKAVQKGLTQAVFVAEDADQQMIVSLTEICSEKGVTLTLVATMKELGEACGIQVGAASAAVLK